MNKIFYTFYIFIIALMQGCTDNSDTSKIDSVNPIIGNESYKYFFGVEPDANTDEFTRVQSHVRYAEELLRSRDISHLDDSQKKMRIHLLDLLREYWQNGVFPENTKYIDQRKPCFIDDSGRICAVGYLVEQTAGRSLAEKINSQYQYSEISEMRLTELDSWIELSGFTTEEVATIQPTYGTYVFRSNQVLVGGGISSRSIEAGYPAIDFGFQHSRSKSTFLALARYESLGPDDYLAGFRMGYSRPIMNTRNGLGIGMTPAIFKENSYSGSNLKPDIAYSYVTKPFWRFSLQMMLSYGYDFALSNADAFPVSRHDLSLRAFLKFQIKTKPKLVW